MNLPSIRHAALLCALTSAAAAQAQATALDLGYGQNALVSYGGSPANFFNGINLNPFVGANAFYDAGFTGTRTTIANIEGGLAYTGHEMTTKIGRAFSGVGALVGSAAVQEHATYCASMAAGYNAANPYDGTLNTTYSTGIAYGAGLWTGNIATSINAATGSFSTTTNSVFSGYYNALIGGVGGATANIVTSSWGATSTNTTTQRQISSGLALDAISVDAVVAASGKLVVFAAGNNGTVGNGTTQAILRTVGSPASGNNALVVGASGPNAPSNPGASYNAKADFSAYGPSAALLANTTASGTGQNGTIVNETTARRARVDLLAPGVEIIGAYYNTTNTYGGGDGTSFAAPMVAGGAALIEDAGQALGYANVTDNRVVTAILQTSATKLSGWTNGSTLVGGVQTTSQALDFNQGAGEMNLASAYRVLTGGTHGVAVTGGKAVVQATGWDYDALSLGSSADYFLTGGAVGGDLAVGSTLTATLRFNGIATYGTPNADGTLVSSANLQYQTLSNFSLQLYRVTFDGLGALATSTLVAESNAAYITSEHFQYTVDAAGAYMMRVNYLSDVYSRSAHGAVGYGLAWAGTQAVPEPASLAALGLGALALLRRRR